MSRIAAKFEEIRKKQGKALITFITAGDPELAVTEKLVPVLEKAGADILELGVPFSDPMADGPTIQKASERALSSGTTLPKILAMVKSARKVSQIPIILMGYYNPIFLYGPERFAADAAVAGVDGVLVVDFPPEEAGTFKKVAARQGLDVIFLLAPTSDDARVAKIAEYGGGFVYYVSVTGVTGARKSVAVSVFDQVKKIKERVNLPVVVGFGISDPVQAGQVAAAADGVVVGSALVKLFEESSGEELQGRLATFVAAIRDGIDKGKQ